RACQKCRHACDRGSRVRCRARRAPAMQRLASFVLASLLCSCAATPSGVSPDGGVIGNGGDAAIDAPITIHDGDGGVIFDPCSSTPQNGYDPAGLTACCTAGPAHCVPSKEVIPTLVAALSACPDGTSVCMPDPIIRGGGTYRPPSCTSTLV